MKQCTSNENFKELINRAYENAVDEYHNYLNSENYDSITSSKLSNVVEMLNNLTDYINFEL